MSETKAAYRSPFLWVPTSYLAMGLIYNTLANVANITFATAFMGLNMVFTGIISGKIQEFVRYKTFFILALVAAIPSILVTIFAPFHHPDSAGAVTEKKLGETAAAPV